MLSHRQFLTKNTTAEYRDKQNQIGMCRFCKSDTKNIESGTADNMMKNADCPAIAKILS